MESGRFPESPRVVCLVGFMGAGKTTVGRTLAARLGWDFEDLDARIVESGGRSIPQIFEEEGEEAFRLMEARHGAELLTREGLVLSTGGGWGAAPGRIAGVPSGVLVIWLRVSPEVAVARVRRQAPGRPLLDGASDPVGSARELLALRTPHYEAAPLHIETTDREVDVIVSRILEHAFPDHASGSLDSSEPNV